jgi:hypothetical protein
MSSDFFFWGFVRNYVYLLKIGNRAHSEGRIQEAAEQLLRNMLHRAWVEVEYLLDVCRDPAGAHVETYSFILFFLFSECLYHLPNVCSRISTIAFSDTRYF